MATSDMPIPSGKNLAERVLAPSAPFIRRNGLLARAEKRVPRWLHLIAAAAPGVPRHRASGLFNSLWRTPPRARAGLGPIV